PSYFVTVIDDTFNFASKADAVSPAGPAPTTSTSVLIIDIASSETSGPIEWFSSELLRSSNRVARTSISAARRAPARGQELKRRPACCDGPPVGEIIEFPRWPRSASSPEHHRSEDGSRRAFDGRHRGVAAERRRDDEVAAFQ